MSQLFCSILLKQGDQNRSVVEESKSSYFPLHFYQIFSYRYDSFE